MKIYAKITGIKYTPLLCKKLHTYNIDDLGEALSKEATFILKISENNLLSLSWWVSAKRTRSYPYARVYDSLGFAGKRVTIIPIFKDEGFEGDRDFLQWDTISLMSLLGIYVIIAYYHNATQSERYRHKITNQRFDVEDIKSEIDRLLSYQSDPLHWNLMQIEKVNEVSKKALEAYNRISEKLGVKMHSYDLAKKRIEELFMDKNNFMKLSRELAEKAQKRESVTVQPKENLDGSKATITIRNYLGGYYFFTSDEVKIEKDNIYLIDAKHTKGNKLPSIGDIKDGLLKMMLFANLEDVKIVDKNYNSIPVLKLTTESKSTILNKSQNKTMSLLKKEAEINKFKLVM